MNSIALSPYAAAVICLSGSAHQLRHLIRHPTQRLSHRNKNIHRQPSVPT